MRPRAMLCLLLLLTFEVHFPANELLTSSIIIIHNIRKKKLNNYNVLNVSV